MAWMESYIHPWIVDMVHEKQSAPKKNPQISNLRNWPSFSSEPILKILEGSISSKHHLTKGLRRFLVGVEPPDSFGMPKTKTTTIQLPAPVQKHRSSSNTTFPQTWTLPLGEPKNINGNGIQILEKDGFFYPKNPWDVGFRVSSCHLFWGPETGCHERRVWCFHRRGQDGFFLVHLPSGKRSHSWLEYHHC